MATAAIGHGPRQVFTACRGRLLRRRILWRAPIELRAGGRDERPHHLAERRPLVLWNLVTYRRQRTQKGDGGDNVAVAHLAGWHQQRNRCLPIGADALTKHSRELRIRIAPD